MTLCQNLLKKEGTARRIENMQQSSTTPKNQRCREGVVEDCCMLSILPSCLTLGVHAHAHAQKGYGNCLVYVCMYVCACVCVCLSVCYNSSVNIVRFYIPSKVRTAFV